MVFDPRKILRLLNSVAVLKGRRENLKLVSQTLDEMRDLTRKGSPPERSLWVSLTNRLFETVDTGDINAIIRNADIVTGQWMGEFLARSTRGSTEGYSYLEEKQDEGQEHLAAMAEIYSTASEINEKVAEKDKKPEFRVLKTIKLTKITLDVAVKVIGALPGVNLLGLPVEVGYELITECAEGKNPQVVGVLKTNVQKEAQKQVDEVLAHAAEHEVDELLRNLGIQGGKNLAEKLVRLETLLARAEEKVLKDWQKAELNSWLKVWARRAGVKAVRKAKWLSRFLGTAHWIFVADEVKGKAKEWLEVWKEKPE